ncbi:MAG: glycosyltransferase family 39 protein [Anaerolineae bacterium]
MGKRVSGILPLGLALLLFFTLSLYQLHLPGLHYDEAQEVLPAMRLLLGQPTEPFRGAAIQIAGRAFPLMIYDYLGTVNTYLVIPFFALLGIDVISLRLMAVLIGALTIVLAYGVAQEMFDEKVAALSALLLSVHPSFIFWSRLGVYLTSVISALSMGSLLAFLHWYRQKKARYLCLGSLLLGLGLFAKFSFLWFLVGLLLAGLLIAAWKRALPRFLTPAQGTLALLFLALGSLPLILFNLQTRGTVEIIQKYLFTSYLGVNNLAFGANFLTRLHQFSVLLQGGQFWYLGEVWANSLYPPLFLLALLSIIPLLFKEREWGTKIAFLGTILVTMLPLSAFTPTGLKLAHYVIFLPLPQILLAASLGLWMRQEPRRLFLPAALLVAIVLIFFDLRVDIGYHRALTRTGGFDGYTEEIYQLAPYLEEKGAPAVAMDWGIRNNILFLTQGRVDPQEVFGFESLEEPDIGFRERLLPHLAAPRTIYIFHSPEETIFERWGPFEALVAERGKGIRVEKVIPDRSGKQIFVVVRVEP